MSRRILTISLVMLCSCNFYKLKEGQLTHKFICAGLKEHRVELTDARMHYWTGGEGSPVVMLHGFGAKAKFQWYDQVGVMKDHHRMIIPNMIFFGDSYSSHSDYSIDYQVEKLMELFDNLGLETFDLIGLSYGGLVAVTLADKYPERVGKLVIADSPIKFHRFSDYDVLLEEFNVDTIEKLLLPESPEGIPLLMELAYYNPPWTPEFVLPNVYEHMFTQNREEKLKLHRYRAEHEEYFTTREYMIHSDVLLIWGRHDKLIPVRVGQQLREYFGDKATLVLVDEAAHMPNMEKPDRFNALVLSFLAK